MVFIRPEILSEAIELNLLAMYTVDVTCTLQVNMSLYSLIFTLNKPDIHLVQLLMSL